ncbi:signal peptidase I [Sphaerospermopsis torques-reginae]|uniref:Signal peptidase I n=1 Tax=Sphaerospermopsis torques-reginae ITEP-024 TaxID=984208 RepID=A0ABX8X2X7_9CYAN|nr:signal peptidase I [Sphaerospermopsis torques-reginae]QYX33053.1 signal peptidase I [Sphaerospermopsis torques-reginae ITEP-024]
MQNQVSDKNSSQQPDNSWIVELGKTVILSVFLALGIRTLVAEARWIPTGSMEPTLHGVQDQWKADKIIVDKVTYKFGNPQRGDIVVFSPTDELKREQYHDAFIKRIIGLPGEKIELKDGKVYINKKYLPEEQYLFPSSRTVVDVCASGSQPPFLAKPQTIPADSYLVLGDNRGSSYDGRCWGLVPRKNIIGRAVIRFWPLNKIGGLDKSPLYPLTNP